jgi:hypothetical protein
MDAGLADQWDKKSAEELAVMWAFLLAVQMVDRKACLLE